nr:FAD-dependent oxidoreductase [Chthonobacter albigriseus]
MVGAGHAHLDVIAGAEAFTRRGHRLTVIAPGDFWYSGLATGVAGGIYPPALDRIDIAALTAKAGGTYHRGVVTGLSSERSRLTLEDGTEVPFDVVSLDIGSEAPPIPGEAAHPDRCFAVKPVRRIAELRATVEARAAAGRPTRIAVAGGGATAAEMAANLEALGRRIGGRVDVTLLAGGERVLAQLPGRAGAAAVDALRRRGVLVRTGARVASVDPDAVRLANGESIGTDLFVNATGLRPRRLAVCDLPLDPNGALVLDRHLRSRRDPRVHGGGDCVAIEGHELPRIGVYAIRQAPVLARNLLAAAEGGEPATFEPQARYLWIMNLGDGTGLAMRGGLWWHGRAAFRLKDWIDRRFLAKYA